MGACGAVILAGGRSSRMQGDKMELVIDGRTLLERAVQAAAGAGAEPIVVAGVRPPGWEDASPVAFVLESPPFGGPVAGIAAALAYLDPAEEVLLLAGDLADPAAVVALLLAQDITGDGIVLEDENGWAQSLAGRYRLEALRGAVRGMGGVRNVSVRALVKPLALRRIAAPLAVTRDLDTPDDAKIARAVMPPKRRPELL